MPINSVKWQSKLCEFSIFTQGCLVQIFTTRGVVVPLENNLIMSGTSIWLFRHLEHQKPSSNCWGKFLVPLSATREAVVLLAKDLIMLGTSIWLFRHLEHQNLWRTEQTVHRKTPVLYWIAVQYSYTQYMIQNSLACS